MSIEANKRVVRRFIEEFWNAGNVAVADELIHPDYAVPGLGQGPEAVKRNVAAYRVGFPDLRWTVENEVAEGEWVAVRLVLHATHLGAFAGVAPTGRRVTMQEMVFWRVVDGRLRTIRSQADALGLRSQLGAIPSTAWHQPVPDTPPPA
jgi:predicted ester cyclase